MNGYQHKTIEDLVKANFSGVSDINIDGDVVTFTLPLRRPGSKYGYDPDEKDFNELTDKKVKLEPMGVKVGDDDPDDAHKKWLEVTYKAVTLRESESPLKRIKLFEEFKSDEERPRSGDFVKIIGGEDIKH